ncbi:1-deoxy-D-xylulose-5-phosphate reductoisomerase [Caldinitratiruptor microaerophilus]|uniref:1-deoxy-D-xylulose 5-phosphate reductoisomerase n=1 Tax=Caldinitratiruptor microaerophilus TaxID=671077 RepID=A0AA35CI04_9FIRM|nr:1-deoxy-D-xylulose-5-phosphate reductoisomerase [Caldinitratiruptor microaerophilus]BDG59384.1 1-deoxy-D-xylulose 5-phosphate reductoisomerase [Caldinitratiruptor microaerophilus]
MLAVSILGSTGSIGTQALDVIGRFPERYRVVALAAGSRVDLLAEQVRRFRPELAAVATPAAARRLADLLGPAAPEIAVGDEGLVAAATWPAAGAVLTAVVGTLGLRPTLAAIRAGKRILLANKETLVAAGELVMAEARARRVALIPVDSEHSALFQCLQGHPVEAVDRLILTGSGGPFRGWTRAQLAGVTPEQALRHPTWQMGRKITVDSATLMNKALELIEARWLFGVPAERIDVLIHPQSIVHSLVQFRDGSLLAQLGPTDMRLPIQYALSYPERLEAPVRPLDLATVGQLTFEVPDAATFPSLNYARAAVTMGGTLPAVMSAANEVAVERFLAGELSFTGIFRVVEGVMARHENRPHPDLEEILAADAWARRTARAFPGEDGEPARC